MLIVVCFFTLSSVDRLCAVLLLPHPTKRRRIA
jgi:hypothetical protein